jgi:hypothetical protein
MECGLNSGFEVRGLGGDETFAVLQENKMEYIIK